MPHAFYVIAISVYISNFLTKKEQKRAEMAVNRSPEFKGVIVQIVCIFKILFESA